MRKQLLFIFTLLAPISLSAQLTTELCYSDLLCHNDSNASVTVVATDTNSSQPILISEIDLGGPDFVELTNVSGQTVDTDGWFLILSDAYNNVNTVNSLKWDLPASVPSGWVDYREDVSGSNYWGNNIYWNPGSYPTYTGWALLSDDQGRIIDFVTWGWPANDLANFNVTHSGFTFTLNGSTACGGSLVAWSGDGMDGNCANTFSRQGTYDNNDATDWPCDAASKGLANSTLTLPFGNLITFDYEWNTGDTTSSLSNLGPGTYSVTTTSSIGDTTHESITFNNPPRPPFNLPVTDTIVCSGGAFIVDAGPQWSTYSWSDGQTGQNILITDSGTYYCTITDTNGCAAIDTLTVGAGVSPSVNLGGDTTLCADEWTLDAGNPGMSYEWSNNTNAQTTTVVESGIYSVTVTSNDGCLAIDYIDLTMYPVPEVDLGGDFSLCINYFETKFLNAGTSFLIYNWSTGASSTTIPVGSGVTEEGSEVISVTVTDENGCTASDSVMVTYEDCSGTGIASGDEKNNIMVFPNPSNGLINIQSSSDQLELIEVYDLTGKLVVTEAPNRNTTGVSIDLSDLNRGTYLLKTISEEESALVRIVLR